MNIAAQLEAFDGRHTGVLECLSGLLTPSKDVVGELIGMAGRDDTKLQTAATWVLRSFQDRGVEFSEDQSVELLVLLGRVTEADARLNLLNILPGLAVPARRTGPLIAVLREYLSDEDKSVRAAAYRGLESLETNGNGHNGNGHNGNGNGNGHNGNGNGHWHAGKFAARIICVLGLAFAAVATFGGCSSNATAIFHFLTFMIKADDPTGLYLIEIQDEEGARIDEDVSIELKGVVINKVDKAYIRSSVIQFTHNGRPIANGHYENAGEAGELNFWLVKREANELWYYVGTREQYASLDRSKTYNIGCKMLVF